MQQYLEIKKKYKDQILFFRLGDFYEMFLEDAIYASKVLDIALTKRRDNVPMCGIPHHALNNYVHQILKSGRDIAVCEQVEDPHTVSGRIVKREVTRILTPGSIFEEGLLHQDNNSLAILLAQQPNVFLVAVANLSTGKIILSSQNIENLNGFLHSHFVKEVIYEEKLSLEVERLVVRKYNSVNSQQSLQKMFVTPNTAILELSENEEKILHYLYLYLQEIAPGLKMIWQVPQRQEAHNTMVLDHIALRTLEILKDSQNSEEASLLHVLNFTNTPFGKRKLAQILSMPLMDMQQIEERFDIVDFLLQEKKLHKALSVSLKFCYDIERLLSSLQNHPQVRHLGQLTETLNRSVEINKSFGISQIPPAMKKHLPQIAENLQELIDELNSALHLEDLPPLLDERRFVRLGYSPPLDELIEINHSAYNVLLQFEAEEKKRLGINTLRIKYNNLLGYFIEISKGASDKAPPEYHRRQTLVGSERFTNDALKTLENKLLNAKEQVVDIQRGIFSFLIEKVLQQTQPLRALANQLAFLDVMYSFAQAAQLQQYIRPTLTNNGEFLLQDARHPVIEVLFKEEVFVPNDIHLNQSHRHLAILTGPNMSGKSTFIRQAGLIQIMAQAGSFVPARTARMSLVDRIFTRIGAYDRLAKGESTFYVEMSECARIFRHYSERSLILLDEVGRGTSTFDGISIARSMIEFFNSAENRRAKVLFATHYAELAEMISQDQGIIGLTVSVIEEKDEVIFLRKIVEGKADKSYGIYVAHMAGLPQQVILRAKQLLGELQEEGFWQNEPKMEVSSKQKKTEEHLQQKLF